MAVREQQETERSRGLLAVMLGVAVFSFALSPILIRLAQQTSGGDVPGVAIAVWRTLIGALLLAPAALWRARDEMRAFTRRDVLLITGAGVMLGLHFIGWIESLYYTTVASASVLVTTSPIFLAILGYVLLGERLRRPVVMAIVVAVLGSVLIAYGDAVGEQVASAPVLGNALALLAAVVVSVYLLIGRVVRRKTSWLAYVFPLYSVTALTTLAAALVLKLPLLDYDVAFFGYCALMAVGPQILGHGTFNYALAFFPAALVSMLALLEPVGASVLAYLLFGEVPPPLATAGMLVVLGALAAIVWVRNRG